MFAVVASRLAANCAPSATAVENASTEIVEPLPTENSHATIAAASRDVALLQLIVIVPPLAIVFVNLENQMPTVVPACAAPLPLVNSAAFVQVLAVPLLVMPVAALSSVSVVALLSTA